jgi:nicotinate-nucleotide pyrophosphorylase (carboxylating)
LDKEFHQIGWDDRLREDAARLVRMAAQEDLGPFCDCTTESVVPAEALGRAAVVVRQAGVIAGLRVAELAVREFEPRLLWTAQAADGDAVVAGQCVARIEGPARGILTSERTMLNLLGRLSGIASLTRRYVEAISGTKARIYDTRKTTPGWRRLEKYAVRLGRGTNHRTGLYDAVLIKDNHLALAAEWGQEGQDYSPAAAVVQARAWLRERVSEPVRSRTIVEVEVDSLGQLAQVLPARPDIVLLDNMGPSQLREAVALRDAQYPQVELEASGGVNLQTVRAIAEAGVDRISVGALTHSALALDIGLDWLPSGLPAP